ncbi:hypothetical protein Tco_1419701, partial [Tanacetum coccineum]
STLTTKELQEAVIEYCIPADLHPRLPPPTLTMDKLPSKGSSKKCFKEVTSSLKGWKKKFFLIDRRTIPDALPWRHTDTDVRDDFLTNYNEGDAERLDEHVIPLRPHLGICYMYVDWPRLARIWSLLFMDDFLQLPMWSETVVSKGDPIPNDQRPANRTTPPLAVGQLIPENTAAQRSIEKPNTKIVEAREKKEKLAHRYAVSSLLDTAYRLSEQYLEISSFKLQNVCLLA